MTDSTVHRLGLGFDLHWGSPYGLQLDRQSKRASLAPPVAQYLDSQRGRVASAFVALQLPEIGELREDAVMPYVREFFSRLQPTRRRGLHHTLLNLCSTSRYDRQRIIAFTNRLIAELNLDWVVEDLGIWSIGGKLMPYPLPPILDKRTLRATVRNVREVAAALDCRLVVEFPGFAHGTDVRVGSIHAFDFFREVCEEADVTATIDVGHLLSYLWIGRSVPIDDSALGKLPLDRCFDVHLSGCRIEGRRFMDLHAGGLLEEQFQWLSKLLQKIDPEACVHFEDPSLTRVGTLKSTSQKSWDRLMELCTGARSESACEE
jgi:uncharacterized protein (UPF0276 family)